MREIKIALITIHDANNYGAALQTYATHFYLSNYGVVSVLNYKNHLFEEKSRLIRFQLNIHGFKMMLHDIARLLPRYRALKRFKNFQNSFFNLTRPLTKKDLDIVGNDFDVYVCGSDQIWNPLITTGSRKFNDVYFLSFVGKEKVKMSYASSMGSYKFDKENIEEIKILLKDFYALSTRESDGISKLEMAVPSKKIHHVLDPTLLLSDEQWKKTLDINNINNYGDYILVYSVPRLQLTSEVAQKVLKKLNLKIIVLDQMIKPITKGTIHIKDAGPKEFIELFSKATYVITDSFHGTCFSIIFGKPFVAVCNEMNSNRITSLLSELSINERVVYNIDQVDRVPPYNSKNVLDKLDKLKELSGDFVDNLKSI